MKKIFLSFSFLFLPAVLVYAQDNGQGASGVPQEQGMAPDYSIPEEEPTANKPVSKDVKSYLPQAGDFAISVSASPFTQFIGNLFNGSTSNDLDGFGSRPYMSGSRTWNYIQPLVSLAGKYMVTDRLGIRFNVGWMYNNDRLNYYAPDDAALMINPLSGEKVMDTYRSNNMGGSFSIAAEYRVGNRRVQGVFGGGLVYALQSDRQTFSYGNAITEVNQNPSCGMDPTVYKAPDKAGFTSMRYLSNYSNVPTHYMGIVAFAGVEWFVAPQISLGGEVNVAAVYNWSQQRYYEAEGFNTLTGKRETWTELQTPSSSGFDFGTGNLGATISVTFYF